MFQLFLILLFLLILQTEGYSVWYLIGLILKYHLLAFQVKCF